MASNKGRKYERMFLIYLYEKFEGNNVKIFNEISSGSRVLLDRDFSSFTCVENNKYLDDWIKENNIKVSNYLVAGDKGFYFHTDKNGTPIVVEKKK